MWDWKGIGLHKMDIILKWFSYSILRISNRHYNVNLSNFNFEPVIN